jgi:O-acetylserine/cysteine efflux transporter
MRPLHMALGVLTAAIWGFNFVVLKVALEDIPPFLLTALRFLFTALPVVILAKPLGMSVRSMVIVGLCTFLGQYAFLFVAMRLGMPPGLSSVTLQLQVFITILLSALLTGERPTTKRWIGGALALAGLGTIAATVGQGTTIPMLALVFIICSASIWAFGNVEMKRAGPDAKFGTLTGIAWANVAAVIPAFGLSLFFEGPEQIMQSLTNLRPITYAAVAFVVVCSSWFGFSIWGKLLATYPASVAAPFALLVPVFGGLSSWLILGETPTPLRLLGSAMIIGGLAINLLPVERLFATATSRS